MDTKNIPVSVVLLNSAVNFDNWSIIIENFSKNNILQATDSYILYKRNSIKDYPVWLRKFNENIKNVSFDKFDKRNSEGLLLLIRVQPSTGQERVFALTFGTGRYLIRDKYIERGFGLYTAYHMSKYKNNKLKSLQSRIVETNPINKKMVFGAEIEEQDGARYITDNESVRELAVCCDGIPYCNKMIGKKKTLDIVLSFEQSELPCIDYLPVKLAKILDDYLNISDEEKSELCKGLVLVDSSKTIELNAYLVENLKNNIEQFFLFEPDIDFDWTDVAKVVYKNGAKIKQEIEQNLSLKVFLDMIKKPSLEDLQKTKIELVNGEGKKIKTWMLFECLYGEIEYNGKVCILSEENWFEIKKDKYERISDNIKRVVNSLEIPKIVTQKIEHEISRSLATDRIPREAIFNKYYAQHLNAEFMDEASKHVNLYEDQIEVCDIFDGNTKTFYHSKIKRGPESISHLFQQGYVSGAAFAKFTEKFVSEVNSKISNVNNQISGTPKDFKINYIILSSRPNPKLTFFQKMTLEEKIVSLEAWGFKVRVDFAVNCLWVK